RPVAPLEDDGVIARHRHRRAMDDRRQRLAIGAAQVEVLMGRTAGFFGPAVVPDLDSLPGGEARELAHEVAAVVDDLEFEAAAAREPALGAVGPRVTRQDDFDVVAVDTE